MNTQLSIFKKDLALKGFSPRTQNNYWNSVRRFLDYCDKPISQIDSNCIRDYLYLMLTEKKLSNSTVRITYSGIKYFFSWTLQRPWEIEAIPQIKKKTKLPSVFSFDEVCLLIGNAANLKHKTILMLIYSSGLRVSECSRLCISDIVRAKMRLLIRDAKGSKDRYTILSSVCLHHLEDYWKAYRPQTYLFPGYGKGKPLSVRAHQHAFEIAKRNAGITKPGGIHILRHSFATHMLETGCGIFQLQKLLGHKHLKTTLVYVHLQEEKVIAKSPLDVYGADL